MEVKETDRVVIAKPVASRPSGTGVRPFSKLLPRAVDASPPPAYACPAIRPKILRVTPKTNQSPHAKNNQSNTCGGAFHSSSEHISGVHNKSTIFKPLAKVVSNETVSLLLSMFTNEQSATNQQAISQIDVFAQQEKLFSFSNQHSSNPSQIDLSEPVDPPTMAQQLSDEEPKLVASSTTGFDNPSRDGYNWRKYGQKQVKGSEYPRSYYKCTHPKCPMKKKVETSLAGQVTEIVYKGEHNHPKPDLAKPSSSGVPGQDLFSGTNQDHNSSDPKLHVDTCEKIDGFEKLQIENAVQQTKKSAFSGNAVDSAELGGNCEEVAKGLKADKYRIKKKRKQDSQVSDAGRSEKGVQEPRICVHNNTELEIASDGFHWRKYGQKVVKGNPYPRSYYRCTSVKCNVRKYVEKALDDHRAFITTYEGRHNHEMPMKITNNSAVAES